MGSFNVKLQAGDKAGKVPHMDPSVANWNQLKYDAQPIGTLSDGAHLDIQFLKPKTFGVLTDYGTLPIPGNQVRGKNVFLFWPNDAPGDAWNDFINDLDQIAGVTRKIATIGDNLLDVAKNAAALAAAVGLTGGTFVDKTVVV